LTHFENTKAEERGTRKRVSFGGAITETSKTGTGGISDTKSGIPEGERGKPGIELGRF